LRALPVTFLLLSFFGLLATAGIGTLAESEPDPDMEDADEKELLSSSPSLSVGLPHSFRDADSLIEAALAADRVGRVDAISPVSHSFDS
jgi:hypothetical protein